MSHWIDVCPAAHLPPGSHALAILNETTPVAVFNLDGQYYAIHDICSHDGSEIADGRVENGQIICPRHGARFCLKTGQALTPPAYEDIATYPVRVVEGMIQVEAAED